jgi:hypothetical protein
MEWSCRARDVRNGGGRGRSRIDAQGKRCATAEPARIGPPQQQRPECLAPVFDGSARSRFFLPRRARKALARARAPTDFRMSRKAASGAIDVTSGAMPKALRFERSCKKYARRSNRKVDSITQSDGTQSCAAVQCVIPATPAPEFTSLPWCCSRNGRSAGTRSVTGPCTVASRFSTGFSTHSVQMPGPALW